MMNFTNRATYLTAVTEWKAQYKELSHNIRAAKLLYKQAQRNGEPGQIWRSKSALDNMSIEAYNMLIDRANGKIEAQKQYMAEKNSTTFA